MTYLASRHFIERVEEREIAPELVAAALACPDVRRAVNGNTICADPATRTIVVLDDAKRRAITAYRMKPAQWKRWRSQAHLNRKNENGT